MRTAIITGAIAGSVLLACAPPQSSSVIRPTCSANNGIVIVQENASPFPCDVVPPMRLDLEMSPEGNPQARCDHFGGRFVTASSEGGEDICQGVDY